MARRGFTVAAMASPEREPAEHRDPFENLRLDEGFVRAARFIEPSAAERGRAGDRRDPGRCQVVPASRRLPAGMQRMVWAPGPGLRRRRLARLVAFVAVLASVVSIVIALRHTASRTTPTAGSGQGRLASGPPVAPATASGTFVPASLLSTLKAGDCVTWGLGPGSTAPAVISCISPHRAEVIQMLDLDGRTAGDGWPGSSELDSLAGTECGDAYKSYISHAKPGLTTVSSALKPGRDAWSAGAKELACTAQLPEAGIINGELGRLPTPS